MDVSNNNNEMVKIGFWCGWGEFFLINYLAEALQDLCMKSVKKHVKEEDMDKLSLPQYMIDCIKQRKIMS